VCSYFASTLGAFYLRDDQCVESDLLGFQILVRPELAWLMGVMGNGPIRVLVRVIGEGHGKCDARARGQSLREPVQCRCVACVF
jgi:hypothetical protein